MILRVIRRFLLGKVGLYDVLVPLGAVAAAPGFLVRSIWHPEYRSHFPERLGILPIELVERLKGAPRRPVWIQSASVGEVILARTLLDAIAARARERGAGLLPRVVVSSTTPAGRDTASMTPSPLLEGVFHFPIDWSPFVRRVLDTVNPAVFISIETEIWPGLLGQCARRGVPSLIVNGRISERSHRRYLRFRRLLREPLRAVSLACMQSDTDAERARSIGVQADRVVVTGNMKFDAVPEEHVEADELRRLAGLPAVARIVVAGSTSAGEEEIVLDALEMLRRDGPKDVVLILAPRHRERFDQVARLLERRGARYIRRSSDATAGPFDVMLLDTLGELRRFYSIATVAFVGGSLVPRGGQNLIEPAARGVPVVFGPHTQSFASVADALLREGGGIRVTDAAGLAAAWRLLLTDDGQRRRAGAAARALIEAHRGATDRTLHHILPFIW